jgi:alkanesulfonate monooxygenase SsuD/methylene tetrahydromethanopterin reductase-like flavin-dependent oxidoreductase (luciferase family)
VKKIRTLAEQQGRSANDIKVFVGITVVVAEVTFLVRNRFIVSKLT